MTRNCCNTSMSDNAAQVPSSRQSTCRCGRELGALSRQYTTKLPAIAGRVCSPCSRCLPQRRRHGGRCCARVAQEQPHSTAAGTWCGAPVALARPSTQLNHVQLGRARARAPCTSAYGWPTAALVSKPSCRASVGRKKRKKMGRPFHEACACRAVTSAPHTSTAHSLQEHTRDRCHCVIVACRTLLSWQLWESRLECAPRTSERAARPLLRGLRHSLSRVEAALLAVVGPEGPPSSVLRVVHQSCGSKHDSIVCCGAPISSQLHSAAKHRIAQQRRWPR